MPLKGKRWRFVTIGTHNAWRPGDARGWRSRKHKRHSSGDYKNPPPPKEHDGLRRWVNERAGNPVFIPKELRSTIGACLARSMIDAGHRVLAVSVDDWHAHIVVELPDHMPTIRAFIGDAKRTASRAVKRHLPGRIWAAGGDFEPIDSKSHLRNATNYVLTKQGPEAWTWSNRQPLPEI